MKFKTDEGRAVSIRQPWATLVILGRKGVESRPMNTKRRGRVFVHASATPMGPEERALAAREGLDPDALKLGAILGSVEIVDARRAADLDLSYRERALGDYRPGRWGWKLANAEPLRVPVACKGALSFWRVPSDVLAEVDALSALIFVYGTLKRGGGNSRLLAGCVFAGEDEVAGTMHDLGAFPGVHLEAGGVVRGELYTVGPAALVKLDRLEGVPTFYQRTRVTTLSGRPAWVYTMSAKRLSRHPVVDGGVWRNRC